MIGVQAIQVTIDGWRQLQDELVTLQERREAVRGAAAPEDLNDPLGDVASIDRRIADLQSVLLRAVPVDHADRTLGMVGVGSCVTVRWEEDEEETYTIVGPPEVDAQAGHISYESPVGQALVGRRAGEWISVTSPSGPMRLKVIAIDSSPSANQWTLVDGA